MPTIRQQMITLLLEEALRARDLSQELHISEKEVYTHLSHITRSVSSQKMRLIITPSQCLSCRYLFKGRTRVTRPGRCPRCKSERIQEPSFHIEQK